MPPTLAIPVPEGDQGCGEAIQRRAMGGQIDDDGEGGRDCGIPAQTGTT